MDAHNEERMEGYDGTETELSDDEFEEGHCFDDLVGRVEGDDPNLTELKVSLRTIGLVKTLNDPNNNDDLPLDRNRLAMGRFGRLAKAIGRNTQLKALKFDGFDEHISDAHTTILFRDIGISRSIKRFHFNDCGAFVGNACHALTRLFGNNQVERIMIVGDSNLSSDSARLVATSLAGFDSLKEFALTDVGGFSSLERIWGIVSRDLVKSLTGHSRLMTLDLSKTDVGKRECYALADNLLQHPTIKLRVLNLAYNHLNDTKAAELASGIAANMSLNNINLAGNGNITGVGWQAIFCALTSSSSCRLKKLALNGNRINDAAALSLAAGIAANMSLKDVNLAHNWNITGVGWQAIFCALSIPNCRLEKFTLNDNRINDAAALSLAAGIATNVSLKDINLADNRNITEVGWQAIFCALTSSSSCRLKKLALDGNRINDAAALSLASGIATNVSLKDINLAGNGNITGVGWQAIFCALSIPDCRLEKFTLDVNEINDAAALSLSNALNRSTTLKTLNLCNNTLGDNMSITITGWHAFFVAVRNCALEELDLSGVRLNDEAMSSLADALAINTSLRSLNISPHAHALWLSALSSTKPQATRYPNTRNPVWGKSRLADLIQMDGESDSDLSDDDSNFGVYCGLTPDGWKRFVSTVLANPNPNSGLEKLGLCEINDAAISVLTNALVNNSKIKVLTLNNNDLITNVGWEMLSSALENPNTALKLDLGRDDDDDFISLLENDDFISLLENIN